MTQADEPSPPIDTPAERDAPTSVFVHAVIGAACLAAFAAVEEALWSRYYGAELAIVSRTGLAALVGAFGLGSLGALSAAVTRYPRPGQLAGAIAVLGTLALAIGTAVLAPIPKIAIAVSACAAGALALAALTRTPLMSIARSLAAVGPYALAGVAAVFVSVHLEYTPQREENAVKLTSLLLGAWGLVTTAFVVFVAAIERRRLSWSVFGLLAIGVALTATVPAWYFGRLTAPKLCFVTFAMIGTCVLSRSAEGTMNWARRAVQGLAVWGAASAVVLALLPIPARFGPNDIYTLSGGMMSVASSISSDDDDDTYFDRQSGGLDPDDESAGARPTDVLADIRAEAPPSGLPPVRHVIVFIVDAMRSDVFVPETTPFLTANDSGFVDFRRAYSPANATDASLPKYLDGSAPRPPGPRDEDIVPLFASLPDDVDAQFAVFTNFIAHWPPEKFSVAPEQLLLTKQPGERGQFAPRVLSWLKSRYPSSIDRRTVSFVYFSDPHAPYVCADGTWGAYDCYIDEIRSVDRFMGDVVQHLREQGLLDQTMLAVTADHGEEFGEHGFYHHTSNVFETQVRVPLFVRMPGIAPRQVATPVSAAGIAATARDALGLPPERTWAYPSLLALALAKSTTYPTPVAHHWQDENHYLNVAIRKSAFIEHDRKLMVDWRTSRFDVSEPENQDALVQDPAVREEMVARYFPYLGGR